MISDIRHEVVENCTILGYYTERNSNSLLIFQDNLFDPWRWDA